MMHEDDCRITETYWVRLAAEYLRVQVDESLPVISGSFDTTLCETLDLISECKDMTKPTVKWQECVDAVNRTAARLRNESQLNVLNIDFVKDVWTNRLPTALKETLLEALLTDDLRDSDSLDIRLMIQAYKQLQEHGFLPEK